MLCFTYKLDGGIEELVDELNTGRIQYAYVKMNDPNTGLPKFVLVNWVSFFFISLTLYYFNTGSLTKLTHVYM